MLAIRIATFSVLTHFSFRRATDGRSERVRMHGFDDARALRRDAMKVTSVILHDLQVRARGRFSVVTTLEFLEHHFAKMSHKKLLVTSTKPQLHNQYNE